MGFKTMDDDKCYVRKMLSQFKWADLTHLFGDQTPQKKKEVEEMLVEAKEATPKLDQAYVKVGLVAKNLVFRIKHSKGHYGEDDIIIIKNYVPPVSDEAIDSGGKALFKESKKPILTVAWWTETRRLQPDLKNLGVYLDAAEKTVALARRSNMLAIWTKAHDDLEAVASAAKDVQGVVTHKDDKACMQHLMHEVSLVQDEFAKAQEVHKVKLAKIAADTYRDYLLPVVTKAETALRNVSQLITSGKLDDANRAITVVAQTCRFGSPSEGKQFSINFKNAASTQQVDEKELVAVGLDLPEKGQITERYNKMKRDYERIRDELEHAESLVLDHEYDHPDRSANQDPTYQRNLTTIVNGYKGVLTAITNAFRATSGDIGRMQQIGGHALTRPAEHAQIAPYLGQKANQLQQRMDATVDEYSKIRSESGSIKKDVVTFKISTEDKAKFTTPILNRCMNVWYQYRFAEQEIWEAIKGSAEAILAKTPALTNTVQPTLDIANHKLKSED